MKTKLIHKLQQKKFVTKNSQIKLFFIICDQGLYYVSYFEYAAPHLKFSPAATECWAKI